jgi:hypothetical protein
MFANSDDESSHSLVALRLALKCHAVSTFTVLDSLACFSADKFNDASSCNFRYFNIWHYSRQINTGLNENAEGQ